MATQTTTEKQRLRQVLPPIQASPEETTPQAVAEPPQEVAQWKDNLGDRIVYVLWMTCFAVTGMYIIVETVTGVLFWGR